MFLTSVFALTVLTIATSQGQLSSDGKAIQEGTGWFKSQVEYTLNFTWPIENFLSLPLSGAHWSFASQQFAAIPTGLRWRFSLYSPGNNTVDGKIYLAIRLETLPEQYEYFLGSAQCGIQDSDGNLKNVVKTGKNALLPTLNLRFDPLIYHSVVVQNQNTLLTAPNGTLSVKCQLRGDLKEDLMILNISSAGVVSRYPSKVVEQLESSQLEGNGDFELNLSFGIENFEAWPLLYVKGDVTFNQVEANLEGSFAYQFRSYNPSNNFYPTYLWLESLPKRGSQFSGSCTCGVIDNKRNKVPGETVNIGDSVGEAFSRYFFAFPRTVNCEHVEKRKSKVMPDGILRIYCDVKGVLTVYPKLKSSG